MIIAKPKIFCALNNHVPKKNTENKVAITVFPPLATDNPLAVPINLIKENCAIIVTVQAIPVITSNKKTIQFKSCNA
jgi:hypothetical protein